MAITEIWHARIDPAKSLSSPSSARGKTWATLLQLSKGSDGFIEQTWCRGHEEPTAVRLHIVRETLEQHNVFRQSENGREFETLLGSLVEFGTEPETHHVMLENITGNTLKAPFTGTALYLSTNEVFTDLVWPLWTHIVRDVPGCLGIISGKVLDHKSANEAFLVYVGWESLEAYTAYWEDPGIDDRKGILGMGNGGRVDFYHLVFQQ